MTAPRKTTVRVASGQGFWGDWLEAPRRQVDGGDVDYLMLDYLAEVTMSILQKQKERDPKMGYARDFVGAIESVLPAVAKRGVRVIANAGGVNPPACAAAIRAVAQKHGVSGDIRIGVVTGDDLLPRLDELIAGGHPLKNMETGEALSTVRDRVLSANAYIGSTPIVEALGKGANIVITGRSTDTALTMAPLRYEFGWGAEDWDRLAAGIIAGHIIECGAQCSGGNCLYDWQNIPDLANVGYPIVEGSADGTFVIYKHPNTGGRISVPSVSEQLVYEMGDPHSYITPDVIADFTSIPRARIACGCSASKAVRRRIVSRSRSHIAPASKRSARSCTRGPTHCRKPSLRTACYASGSTDWVSSSSTFSPSSSASPRRTDRSPAKCTIRRKCSSESACVVRTNPPWSDSRASWRPSF
jgi:hypothetical protein